MEKPAVAPGGWGRWRRRWRWFRGSGSGSGQVQAVVGGGGWRQAVKSQRLQAPERPLNVAVTLYRRNRSQSTVVGVRCYQLLLVELNDTVPCLG